MKKQKWFYVLTIICLISISANALFVIGYYNTKKAFLYDTYSHLVNITQLIDNLTNSIATGEDIANYTYSALNKECLQLDDSIHGLSVISSDSSVTYYFADFYKSILSVIQVNSDNSEKAINDLTQHKEKLQNLIAQLSPNGELNYNEHGTLSKTPNYSLRVRNIISFINAAFADQ